MSGKLKRHSFSYFEALKTGLYFILPNYPIIIYLTAYPVILKVAPFVDVPPAIFPDLSTANSPGISKKISSIRIVYFS